MNESEYRAVQIELLTRQAVALEGMLELYRESQQRLLEAKMQAPVVRSHAPKGGK